MLDGNLASLLTLLTQPLAQKAGLPNNLPVLKLIALFYITTCIEATELLYWPHTFLQSGDYV